MMKTPPLPAIEIPPPCFPNEKWMTKRRETGTPTRRRISLSIHGKEEKEEVMHTIWSSLHRHSLLGLLFPSCLIRHARSSTTLVHVGTSRHVGERTCNAWMCSQERKDFNLQIKRRRTISPTSFSLFLKDARRPLMSSSSSTVNRLTAFSAASATQLNAGANEQNLHQQVGEGSEIERMSKGREKKVWVKKSLLFLLMQKLFLAFSFYFLECTFLSILSALSGREVPLSKGNIEEKKAFRDSREGPVESFSLK